MNNVTNVITPSTQATLLAQTLGGSVYLVGGFVRNSLLGKECEDEDICSPLTLSELEQKLEGTSFSLKNKNKAFGTCKITCEDKSFDYATFRKDTYSKGHCPDEVEFVTDIAVDAQRRDFTINAIYYDILTGKIIDFFDGVGDLKKKRIKAINPSVLQDDGVRILRMLRLAGEYNFSIEKKTLASAQKNIENIRDLTNSKVTEEFSKLFARTNSKGAVRAIKLYNRLGIWRRMGTGCDYVRPVMVAKCEDKFMGFIIDLIDAIQKSKSANLSLSCRAILTRYISQKTNSTFSNISIIFHKFIKFCSKNPKFWRKNTISSIATSFRTNL